MSPATPLPLGQTPDPWCPSWQETSLKPEWPQAYDSTTFCNSPVIRNWEIRSPIRRLYDVLACQVKENVCRIGFLGSLNPGSSSRKETPYARPPAHPSAEHHSCFRSCIRQDHISAALVWSRAVLCALGGSPVGPRRWDIAAFRTLVLALWRPGVSGRTRLPRTFSKLSRESRSPREAGGIDPHTRTHPARFSRHQRACAAYARTWNAPPSQHPSGSGDARWDSASCCSSSGCSSG